MNSNFLSVNSQGGIATIGGDNSTYESIRVEHESEGTYHVTWSPLSVIPAVLVTAHHGVDQAIVGTAGYVTEESMYVYTRNMDGQLVDEQFSMVMYS